MNSNVGGICESEKLGRAVISAQLFRPFRWNESVVWRLTISLLRGTFQSGLSGHFESVQCQPSRTARLTPFGRGGLSGRHTRSLDSDLPTEEPSQINDLERKGG